MFILLLQGICQRQSTDIVARIWEFFEDLTFNSVGKLTVDASILVV